MKSFITDNKYQEILKLAKMLRENDIPHTLDRLCDGWQVVYYKNGEPVADAIEHRYSYGNGEDLLEIMGLLTSEEKEHDSVLGYLTAEDVFERIKKHYMGGNK